MTEGDRSGLWAMVYLLMVFVAECFTISMIIFSFVKNLLRS